MMKVIDVNEMPKQEMSERQYSTPTLRVMEIGVREVLCGSENATEEYTEGETTNWF